MATSANESVIAGPAPGRPNCDVAWEPFKSKSITVASRIDLMGMGFPAAAVPVRVKIPLPITAPMPRAVRLHGPSVLRRLLRGSSDAAISSSMLFVRNSWLSAVGLPAFQSVEGGGGLRVGFPLSGRS